MLDEQRLTDQIDAVARVVGLDTMQELEAFFNDALDYLYRASGQQAKDRRAAAKQNHEDTVRDLIFELPSLPDYPEGF
jgi:hypothetical protein